MLVLLDRWNEMRLPKHSAVIMALVGAAVVLGAWPRWRSSSLPPLTTAAGGLTTDTIVQTTRTLTDQRIEFPSYRNQFTAVRMEIRAGGQTGRYKHLVPSFVYVLEGTLTFEVEGHKPRTFSAGQGFAPGIDVWHNAGNRTNAPARILVVYVGTDEQKLNVRAADDAVSPPQSPFDSIVGH